MRNPIWESTPNALTALMHSGEPMLYADLFTITLNGGQILRYTSSDFAVTANGATWVTGIGFSDVSTTIKLGVEVDTMPLTIYDDGANLINGNPVISFIANGGLDEARVQLTRAFAGTKSIVPLVADGSWAADGSEVADGIKDGEQQDGSFIPVGILWRFSGRVESIAISRGEARVTVKSDMALLNVMVPRDVYQSPCRNTFGDLACGKNLTALKIAGVVTAASNTNKTDFGHAMAQAAEYFSLGGIEFTSGANIGQKRTVRQHSISRITFWNPLPFALNPGDTFTVYPGCNKTVDHCKNKHSNLIRFRGEFDIPVAESVI